MIVVINNRNNIDIREFQVIIVIIITTTTMYYSNAVQHTTIYSINKTVILDS